MEKIKEEVDQTLMRLEAVFAQFNPDKINEVPFKGSWTAAQLIQHLILANGGFPEIIGGANQETSRPADFNVAGIRKDLLNFEVKYDAPAFICPELKPYDQSSLLASLSQIRQEFNAVTTNLDLTKTCTTFEMPFYGYLTRLEALNFVSVHTQRHLRQLEHIYQVVN